MANHGILYAATSDYLDKWLPIHVGFMGFYPLVDYISLLKKEIITEYFENDSITKNTFYSYGWRERIIQIKRENSGKILLEKYLYPKNNSALAYANIIGKPIKQTKLINDLPIEIIEERYHDTDIFPHSKWISSKNINELIEFEKYEYDTKGNFVEVTDQSGLKTAILWSYKHSYPLATFRNISYAQINSFLEKKGINVEALSDKNEPSDQDYTILSSSINSDTLKNVELNIYSYTPLIGVSKIINSQGITNHYEYDSEGRLMRISSKNPKTQEVEIIEEYQYNYANSSLK